MNIVSYNLSLILMLSSFSCYSDTLQDATDKEPVTHCDADEKIYFSCQTSRSKILSLCGTIKNNDETSDGPPKSLQYRFGKLDKIELMYPDPSDNDSLNLFFYNHYFRSLADYAEIGFTNNQYEYRIYRHYDKISYGDRLLYGISILSKNEHEIANIRCSTVSRDRIIDLTRWLPCNKDNALGCNR